MYYLIAFILFFYMGYKVRGAVEIYKATKIKNYIHYFLDDYFNNDKGGK